MGKINCALLTSEDYSRLKEKFGDAKAHYLWSKLNGEIPEDLDSLAKQNIRFQAAQVLLPYNKIIKVLNANGISTKNLSAKDIKALISPEVLKGLSYRIPNQAAPSTDLFEIVGILPEEMGDTMISYKEITVKTGSDFDIDKAYIVLPNFDYDPTTKRLEITKDDSKEGLQNRRLKLMRLMLGNPNKYIQLMRPLDAPWLKDLVTKQLIKPNKEVTDLQFWTGSSQALTKSLFDGAKSLVGVIAKHMTHHNLTIHENLTYKGTYLGKGKYNIKETKQEDRTNIYNQLGNKTKSEHIIIKSWGELKDATTTITPEGVISTRIKNTEEHFGNPFSHDPAGKTQGLFKTETIKEAVEKYTDWVINSQDTRANWIREQLKSGKLKNQPILYYKELGEPSHATALDYLINKYDWNTIENQKTTIKIKESIVSSELDEDGNSVEETLIAYANAIVDAAKDPFILKANINQFTANTAFMLARAGVSRNWISAFMMQPILVDLVKEMNVSEGRVASETRDKNGELITALDKVLKKYGITKTGKEFKKDYPNLKNSNGEITVTFSTLKNQVNKTINDEIEEDTENINDLQAKVLGQFIEWQNKASDLSDLMKATSADTDGATKNGITAKMRDNKMLDVIQKDAFNNLDTFIGYTKDSNGNITFNGTRFIGTMHKNSVQFLMKTAKQVFVSSSDSFLHSLFNISKLAGYNSLEDEDIAKVIENELFAAFISQANILSFSNKEDLKHLLFNYKDQISLSQRVIEARKLYPYNLLLQSFSITRGNSNIAEMSTIGLSPKNLDKNAKNNFYLHWEDLLVKDKKLGEDLIKYAFYSSGLSPNFKVFYEHIPISWLEKNGFTNYIENQLIKLNETPNALAGMEDQVFRHLYKNNKIVPTISPKAIKKNIKTDNGMIISPLDYIFIDEFNATNLKIGENREGKFEHKPFIKTKSTDSVMDGRGEEIVVTTLNLYKLAGYSEKLVDGKIQKQVIYERTNPLGSNEETNIIKEYNPLDSKSIFPKNNYVIKQEIVDAVRYSEGFKEIKGLDYSKEMIVKENKSDDTSLEDYLYCKRD